MRRNKFRPQRKFESLEDRRMMAADINFDKGIVTVQGTENQDHVIVQVNPDDSDEILVSIRNLETGELVRQEDFDRDDVVKVVANGYGNDDYFQNFTGIRGEFFGVPATTTSKAGVATICSTAATTTIRSLEAAETTR